MCVHCNFRPVYHDEHTLQTLHAQAIETADRIIPSQDQIMLPIEELQVTTCDNCDEPIEDGCVCSTCEGCDTRVDSLCDNCNECSECCSCCVCSRSRCSARVAEDLIFARNAIDATTVANAFIATIAVTSVRKTIVQIVKRVTLVAIASGVVGAQRFANRFARNAIDATNVADASRRIPRNSQNQNRLSEWPASATSQLNWK